VGTGVGGYSVAWGGAAVAADTTKDLGASASSFTSSPQPDGDRYVALRTVDEAGNWSGQLVEGPFRIDTRAPADAQIDDPISTFTWSTDIPVGWSGGADGGSGFAGFDVRSRVSTVRGDLGASTAWLVDTSATTGVFAGSTGSTRCFSARTGDLVGNHSAWSDEACTAIPLDADALVARGKWIERTGGVLGAGLMTTKSRGSTLTLKNVQARRFAFMATTCPTCGAVRVLWRGRLLTKVNLREDDDASGVVFALGAKASAKAGTLVIEVTSRHKKVAIDAVGATRL
jgi:hypothetical protein